MGRILKDNGGSMPRPTVEEVALWHAINNYVLACEGNPSAVTISDKRMDAVVEVSRAREAIDLRAAQRWRGVVDEIRAAVDGLRVNYPSYSSFDSGWNDALCAINDRIAAIIAKHAAGEGDK